MITVAISVLALVASGYTLWRTQLAPARLTTATGPLRLRVYPFNRAGRHWVMPALHLSITITNAGARSALIEEMRIVVCYPDFDGGQQEVFLPLMVLREPLGMKHDTRVSRDRRFESESEWMPIIVPSQDTVTQNVEFQDRAWHSPPIGIAEARLDIKARGRAWIPIEIWSIDLPAERWHLLYGGMAVRGSKRKPRVATAARPYEALDAAIASKATAELGPDPYGELRSRSEARDEKAAKVRRKAGE